MPGVGGRARGGREAALHARVEVLGEFEGVLAAVGRTDVGVGHAVGFEDGRDLVGVDGGGDQLLHAVGEFVDGVGGDGVRTLSGDEGQGVLTLLAQPERTAHQTDPSDASSRYQGSTSSSVQSSCGTSARGSATGAYCRTGSGLPASSR